MLEDKDVQERAAQRAMMGVDGDEAGNGPSFSTSVPFGGISDMLVEPVGDPVEDEDKKPAAKPLLKAAGPQGWTPESLPGGRGLQFASKPPPASPVASPVASIKHLKMPPTLAPTKLAIDGQDKAGMPLGIASKGTGPAQGLFDDSTDDDLTDSGGSLFALTVLTANSAIDRVDMDVQQQEQNLHQLVKAIEALDAEQLKTVTAKLNASKSARSAASPVSQETPTVGNKTMPIKGASTTTKAKTTMLDISRIHPTVKSPPPRPDLAGYEARESDASAAAAKQVDNSDGYFDKSAYELYYDDSAPIDPETYRSKCHTYGEYSNMPMYVSPPHNNTSHFSSSLLNSSNRMVVKNKRDEQFHSDERDQKHNLVSDKTRSTFQIMDDLVKRADIYKLPLLQYHTLASQRKNKFTSFIRHLGNILRLVPELRHVLIYYPQLGRPVSEEANEAFFELLNSHCDHQFQSILYSMRERVGFADGMEAFLTLRDCCFAQDSFQQNSAIAYFENMAIGNTESVVKFSLRFNRALDIVRMSGKSYSPTELVDRYLQALFTLKGSKADIYDYVLAKTTG
jgi:hypothetical protein